MPCGSPAINYVYRSRIKLFPHFVFANFTLFGVFPVFSISGGSGELYLPRTV
jgi:hypothetical protein